MTNVFLHGAFEGNRGDMLMKMATQTALEERGMTVVDDETEADTVINCCGYWCGDAWGEPWSRKMRERIEQWKDGGKTVILLPQTFGPFTDSRIGDEARIIADKADLVCVRDDVSYRLLTDICGEQENIRRFPDYTIDVPPVSSRIFQPHDHSVAVIPNLRMTDKTPRELRDSYVPFLERCISILIERGMQPFLLIHEEKDTTFSDVLSSLPLVIEPDAQATKWIIGQSAAIISSRYHGILNALYQDVPLLATGWCHKFPALMEEWGCADRLAETDAAPGALEGMINMLLDDASWSASAGERDAIRNDYRRRTNKLWETATLIM